MDRRGKPGGDGTGRKAGTSLTVAGAFRRRPGPSKTPYPGLTERRPDMTSSPSLRLSGISKRYPGVQALAGMSFDCLPGEVHAVLGENGSGKSTLLKIAAGAVAADAGRVEIMGAPLTAADPMQARRLGLATVYQDDSLVRELTVAENLYLGCPAGGDHAPPPVAGMASWAAAQLDRYGLDLAPQAIVGSLTPSQRQFLEIVKALTAAPKVLLLDEPTSTLDLPDVEKLTAIIRQAQAAGTAIVYVSHRLPEILDLADRVTILRDGVGRGTYPVGPDLSEAQLVALMVGRPVESEYPAKLGARAATAPVVLEVQDLQGAQFSGLSFQVRAGEVLGFAGAEGNGQRQALRALGGFLEARGRIACHGRPIPCGAPRRAMAGGITMLSADRAQESIFPALGVRENMTLQVLGRYAGGGLVSARRERADAAAMVAELGIVTAGLEQPIGGLSGGNQQKAVLGRSFLQGAPVVLIDEPTQGVDANARFDIYQAIRGKAEAGASFVINSSDALELAGICDRVLVFSRGHVIRELAGDEVTEENIVSAFLTSTRVRGEAEERTVRPGVLAGLLGGGLTARWWTPLLFLALLLLIVGGYAATQSEAFLTTLNFRHILLAAAPLALVTMAQFNVLMVGGFDISVGSLMSVTVVLASFLIAYQMGPSLLVLGFILCLAAGLLVGAVNGLVVRRLGINSVITTIAMLSVLQGIALYLRPTPAGVVSLEFLDLLKARAGFVPLSFFLLVVIAIAGDWWLYRSASGLRLRATGFREEAAKRNGVRTDRVHIRAYLLSGLLAALAGLFLSSEVGVGHPTVGATYTLTSIAAAVLGGAALTGGRGSFLGALLGALFFTLTVNIIPLLGLNTAVGIIASGGLTLFAVLVYSGWEPVGWLLRRLRAAFAGAIGSARVPT